MTLFTIWKVENGMRIKNWSEKCEKTKMEWFLKRIKLKKNREQEVYKISTTYPILEMIVAWIGTQMLLLTLFLSLYILT